VKTQPALAAAAPAPAAAQATPPAAAQAEAAAAPALEPVAQPVTQGESATRLAAHVRGQTPANASSVRTDVNEAAGKAAPATLAAAAAPVQNTAAPTASTSAFAAQIEAQAQEAVAPLAVGPDTVPTAQTASATQTASTPATPAATSLSSLSRATLETTIQIAAQITRQLAGRSTRFEMGLTPEGLGKVNVSMDIDASGRLTAQLAFDNPLAAADLRARADELRSQLQDAGFTLTDDALSFTQQDASSSNGGDRSSDQRESRAFASASRISDQADDVPPVPAAWVSLSLTPRGVDMKV